MQNSVHACVRIFPGGVFIISVWFAKISMKPNKNTGVGYHALLQEIFPTQGSNPCLLYWQVGSLPLSHWGSQNEC